MVKKMFRLKCVRTGRVIGYLERYDDGKRLAGLNQLDIFEVTPCLVQEVEKEENSGCDPEPSNGE